MTILFEHPLSPYAQKVKIALREKGVEFALRLPAGVGSGIEPDPTFAEGNPRLEVPFLVDGSVRIFDSTIQLEYVEERWPEPALLPSSPADRAKARTIEEVMDTHYEAITWTLAEIRYFGRADGKLAGRMTEAAREQLERLHGWLEERLSTEGWLNGDEFGWADLAAVPFVNGAVGFDLGPSASSRLGWWLESCNERNSVSLTAGEAAAAIGGMENVGALLEQGLFKRQYRDHRLEWMIRSGGLGIVEDGLAKANIRFNDFP